MNRFLKFFMLFTFPLLSIMLVSCGDDEIIDEIIEPVITAVNPTEGFVGDEVIITGTGFDEVNAVRFGTVDAVDFDVTPTQITAVIPAGVALGQQQITVASPEATDTFDFTVLEETVDAPTVTSFDPVSGVAGDVVTVTGTNLDLVTSARFGDIEIPDFVAEEDGVTATFTVPEGAESNFITLLTEAGDEVVTADQFVIEEDADFAFDPLTGPVGTEVTLSGADFTGTSAVRIGDVDITDFTVADDGSSLVFTIPEGAVTGPLTVTTPEGDLVSTDDFVVGDENTVSIASFEPTSGVVGDVVTVTGTNLDMVASALLGDVVIQDFVAEEDGLTASFTVPEGAVTGPIILINDADEEVMSDEEFVVDGETTAFSTEPVIGPVGTEVTLSGIDFTGTSAVRIGEMDITDFTVADDGSSLVFSVPEGAATGFITATTPMGDIESSEQFIVGDQTVIFDDEISDGWSFGEGFDVTVDPENTEQVFSGENAAKLMFTDARGGVQLNATETISLDGNEHIVISVFGPIGSGDISLAILEEGQNLDEATEVNLDLQEEVWQTFVIPVSELGNPATLSQLVIRNVEVPDNIVYIDNISIVQ